MAGGGEGSQFTVKNHEEHFRCGLSGYGCLHTANIS